MPQVLDTPTDTEFVERRTSEGLAPTVERRQFGNSYSTYRPEVAEFARAVDQYKLLHRRRFITYEELYDVIRELGYQRPAAD